MIFHGIVVEQTDGVYFEIVSVIKKKCYIAVERVIDLRDLTNLFY